MGQELSGVDQECPVAENVSSRLVRLPLFNGLTSDELERISDAINEYCF